jgi:hypothetical protein
MDRKQGLKVDKNDDSAKWTLWPDQLLISFLPECQKI